MVNEQKSGDWKTGKDMSRGREEIATCEICLCTVWFPCLNSNVLIILWHQKETQSAQPVTILMFFCLHWQFSDFHSALSGTHKDHRVKLLAPHGTTQNPDHISESNVQMVFFKPDDSVIIREQPRQGLGMRHDVQHEIRPLLCQRHWRVKEVAVPVDWDKDVRPSAVQLMSPASRMAVRMQMTNASTGTQTHHLKHQQAHQTTKHINLCSQKPGPRSSCPNLCFSLMPTDTVGGITMAFWTPMAETCGRSHQEELSAGWKDYDCHNS